MRSHATSNLKSTKTKHYIRLYFVKKAPIWSWRMTPYRERNLEQIIPYFQVVPWAGKQSFQGVLGILDCFQHLNDRHLPSLPGLTNSLIAYLGPLNMTHGQPVCKSLDFVLLWLNLAKLILMFYDTATNLYPIT